jgi:ribonuclease J
MENVIRLSRELGYMNVPDGILVDINQIGNYPKNKIVIISTGSQGETMSALYRMTFNGHKQVDVQPGDRVIISASAVPGTEKTISRVINELFSKGADVKYDEFSDLHASGHACQDELKMLIALTQPRFFIPVHGEHRHLRIHATLAAQMGVKPKNILIPEIGRTVEFTKASAKFGATVPSGRTLIDGAGIGDVGSVVLRDRRHLAQDGMIVVVMNLSNHDSSLVSGPDIITRGFVYVKESEELIENLRQVVLDILSKCEEDRIRDYTSIRNRVKTGLNSYLYKTIKRSPMILPVIMPI